MAQPTAVTIPSRYSILPVEFTWAACTTVTPTDVDWMPGDIGLLHNTNVAAKTVTVVSKPKAKRADYSITAFSLGAGKYYVLPRFGPQDEEVLSVVAEHADVLMARLSTAPQPS